MQKNNRVMKLTIAAAIAVTGMILYTSGFAGSKESSVITDETCQAKTTAAAEELASKPKETVETAAISSESSQLKLALPLKQSTPPAAEPNPSALQVVTNPTAITVMVNKSFKLPESYKPAELIEPNVPFVFKEHLEKRKMRKEAAAALENLFAAAKKDGVPLAGVSAYRSYETQKTLYTNYIKKDGKAAADKYSAQPGTSEHQTGLAIDVSGSGGKCAAADCFANTKEAKWLVRHAPEFGFIIRYPKGKEAMTGYQYEPWHLRYVGAEIAKIIASKNLTLEEYFGSPVPAAKPQ